MVLSLAKATSHNNLGSDIEGITVDKDALLACSEISIKENDFALRRDDEKDSFIKTPV